MKGFSMIRFWEVTGDKGVVHFTINIKFTVIVAEPGSPIQNASHLAIIVFFETNVIYPQYKTEATTYHYI